ncbi:hypothetical protein [Streptomyces sp. ODS28]|uniref:hypothetical protein n=1 Tax=Streptomyces sp. ODS28 TaxID=3136688 RepID=UPI0031E71D87
MNSLALPRRSPKPASVLLAAASATVIALVLYLNSVDNGTMCANHPVNVSWSRLALAYGGLAMAVAGLVIAIRVRWAGRAPSGRPRGSLAMVIVAVLLVAMACLAAVSTHSVLEMAEFSRQPNSLMSCT